MLPVKLLFTYILFLSFHLSLDIHLFLFILELESIVCEVNMSFIAYVRENYLKLCRQAFVSSNRVSAYEWKAPF